jgi:hypothetical protein
MAGPISRTRRTLQRLQNLSAKRTVDAGRTVLKNAKKLPAQVQALRRDGFATATRNNWRNASEALRNPTRALGVGHAISAYGAVHSAARLPGQALTAGRDVRDALRNPTRENVARATNSTITAARGAVSTVSGGLQTARDVHRGVSAYRAASRAIRTAAPNMSPAVRRAATFAATRSAFSGTAPRGVEQATRSAMDRAIRRSGGTVASQVLNGTSRTAARQVLGRTATAAGRAAAPAVARAAAGPAARAAGRFVPGANVAIAALDTARFVSDMRNPNASTGTRIASGVTALGSIAAATNIPVVSQVGAGVAAVGGVIRGLFGG